MKIKCFTFNTFQENTYVVYDKTKECIIIDPGCYSANEEILLQKFITSEGLNPVKLINTHCHIDHVLGNEFVSKQWKIELYMHKQELPILDSAKEIGKMYGFKNYKHPQCSIHFLKHNDLISFGDSILKILFTPGHSPGHICLYSKSNDILIAGDLIFRKSIGRTDLPGGEFNILIDSIASEIVPLKNSTKIYSGHGPSSNLDFEKNYNPFLSKNN